MNGRRLFTYYLIMGASFSVDHLRDILAKCVYPLLHPVEQFACSLVISGAPQPIEPLRFHFAVCGITVSYMGVLTASDSSVLSDTGLRSHEIAKFSSWASQYPDYVARSQPIDDRGIVHFHTDESRSVSLSYWYDVPLCQTLFTESTDILIEYSLRCENDDWMSPSTNIPDTLSHHVPNLSEKFVVRRAEKAISSTHISTYLSLLRPWLCLSPHWRPVVDLLNVDANDILVRIICNLKIQDHVLAYAITKADISSSAYLCNIVDALMRRPKCHDLLAVLHDHTPANVRDLSNMTLGYDSHIRSVRDLFEVFGEKVSVVPAINFLIGMRVYLDLFGMQAFLKNTEDMPERRIIAIHALPLDAIDYAAVIKSAPTIRRIITLDRVDILRRLVETEGYSPIQKIFEVAIKKNSRKCMSYLIELRDWRVNLSKFIHMDLHAETIELLMLTAN